MGFISDMVSSKTNFPGQGRERSLWNQTFGTDKETSATQPKKPKGSNNSWGNSLSTNAALIRLIEAFRSMAPGGWSDDRWEQTKHFVGIQYVCIHRSGEQLMQAEFQVFKKDPVHPDGKRPVKESDPPEEGRPVRPYDLVKLLERPNNDDTFGDLMYSWNQQMDLTGKALTWMLPNLFQVPIELYSIPTAIAIPQPVVNPDYPSGYYRIQPVYPYGPFSSYPTPNSAVGAAIPREWMLEFKYIHPFLRYDGYSPLTAMRLHLDEVEAMDRSRWYAMKREFQPSAVLNFSETESTLPLPDAEIERIRADFEIEHQGQENRGRLLVSTPGAELEPWGTSPREMDYVTSWDQLASFAMAGFGITKPAAGMIEDSSYASLFATLKQLHLLTLTPKCQRIAAKLTRHVAPFFGDDLVVEIRCPRIDDHDVKNTKLELLSKNKAITKNELRKELDMPITEEPWGEDMAGDPSPAEKEQQQQAQQQQSQQMEQQGKLEQARVSKMGNKPEGKSEEPVAPEEEERPTTGNLGKESLGPRKSYKGLGLRNLKKTLARRGESLYQQVNGDL